MLMGTRHRIATFSFLVCVFSICFSRAAASVVCKGYDISLVVGSQCPDGVDPSPPLQVTGEILDMTLNQAPKKAIHSVLLHASWCPFSQRTVHVFEALSYMYPQIRHLSVDESSASPSVFSRYGIRSFPSILIVNQTRRVHYHGPKDINSLIQFYRKVTGLEPIAQISMDQTMISEGLKTLSKRNGSPKAILKNEPYLAFAIAFVCVRAFVYLFPGMILKLKAMWASQSFHFNLGIFKGSCQLLHLIDMKWLWSILWLTNKTRNLQKGANNARVWATSLASVSLGESSTSRTSTCSG